MDEEKCPPPTLDYHAPQPREPGVDSCDSRTSKLSVAVVFISGLSIGSHFVVARLTRHGNDDLLLLVFPFVALVASVIASHRVRRSTGRLTGGDLCGLALVLSAFSLGAAIFLLMLMRI